MNEKLIKQIMEDYSCSYEDVIDKNNHFTIYKVNEGRRKYKHIEECFLRMIIINSKLIFSGCENIIEIIKEKFEKTEGQWILEPENICILSNILNKYNYKISMIHPFFISEYKSEINSEYNITMYNRDELQKFRNDERFDEAFGTNENTPDVIACSISINNEIVGMAGASMDSPYMMQIGINVNDKYKGKRIATALVSTLKNKIIDMGYVPYYGTSFSHIASMKVALNSGFKNEFIELFTMPK